MTLPGWCCGRLPDNGAGPKGRQATQPSNNDITPTSAVAVSPTSSASTQHSSLSSCPLSLFTPSPYRLYIPRSHGRRDLMATPRPHTPSGAHHTVPTPQEPAHLNSGSGAASHADIDATDFTSNPTEPSHLSQSMPQQRHGRFEEDFDARTRGSSIIADGDVPQRSASRASTLNQGATPSRSGTLKKKGSIKRGASLKRSGSRRSTYAGSIRGVSVQDVEKEHRHNSVFYTPVPTSGSPTELLANRFQGR